MVSFRSGVVAAITALSAVGSIQALPLVDKLRSLSPSARDALKTSTPTAPRFVVYNDKKVNPFPSASELRGFNVFALAFLLASGSIDQARSWQKLSASQRASYVQEYNSAGISLIVSAFGSTDTPTTSGADAVTTANTMADWVIQYGVNGIDVDYEDFTAFNGAEGTAETWLISFTKQLRAKLPQGQYILTHAPVAPWFSPSIWSGGGYLAVDKNVGSLINWYNVQFYNQGVTEYTTCSGLLDASSSKWPQSALFQIAANGVSKDKLVIGKPATASDSTNGYMDPSTLASCISEAASKGWNAGITAWQFPDANPQWITTVRGNTRLVTRSFLTAARSKCAGISACVNSTGYSSGNKITYKRVFASPLSHSDVKCRSSGNLRTANEWNKNDTPGGSSGAWMNDGAST